MAWKNLILLDKIWMVVYIYIFSKKHEKTANLNIYTFFKNFSSSKTKTRLFPPGSPTQLCLDIPGKNWCKRWPVLQRPIRDYVPWMKHVPGRWPASGCRTFTSSCRRSRLASCQTAFWTSTPRTLKVCFLVR